ncbi:S8 family serine peptidase [uncultured Psychroserpens sp.]|uniref:S8 family serine peptidase n=1 Tax=uncultured Psychroserpens sp. TaxID=255436 RepID=UPI002628E923|nr:S8 family serine peptidase [uncultured Psychroserpens sp.]
MKSILRFLSALALIVIWSCEKETISEENIHSEKNRVSNHRNGNSTGGNELIILYPEGTTNFEKQQKRIEYGVTEYKQCKCADENLELWIFDESNTNNINIEEKKETAKVDEEIEGTDLNPVISIPHDQLAFNFNSFGVLDDAVTKVVALNQSITIAVLDTGINYHYDGFSNSFLYNASEDACIDNNSEELFGWNFVENNNDPFDNHLSMHGTVVSHIITSNLDSNNVPYQLLPVKIANENGNINYFDALCGFQYATKKRNIKIINMSFGWYNQDYEILNKFIDTVEDDILVVCSAGNEHQNNDHEPHFPSSFESENVLSIAGLSGSFNTATGPSSPGAIGLSDFSNFGNISVDVAAISENIPFVYNNETYYYNGTSFSAAYASFYSAYHYQNGMSAQTLKNQVIASSIYIPSLFKIKHSAFLYVD